MGSRKGRAMATLAIVALAAGMAGEATAREKRDPRLPMQTELKEVAQPTAGLTEDQRLAKVVELLSVNDEAAARVELAPLLNERRVRHETRTLQRSIEGNPYDMVPRGSFAYVVQPGDSYITIARDYLGDSYKFYALARLNGIAVNVLKPGDTLQIPGRARAARRPQEDRPRAAPPRARAARPAATDTVAAPPAVATPRTDPAGAQRMRRAGLELMSAGRVDQAVARLEQAARLDPSNAAIGADLARARRVQSSVRGN